MEKPAPSPRSWARETPASPLCTSASPQQRVCIWEGISLSTNMAGSLRGEGEEAWKPGSPGLLQGLCPPEPPLGKGREERCRLAVAGGEGHAAPCWVPGSEAPPNPAVALRGAVRAGSEACRSPLPPLDTGVFSVNLACSRAGHLPLKRI